MYKLMLSFEKDNPKLTKCLIKGTIPSWLNGNLYRNGSGLFKFGSKTFNHMFDGMAVLHRFYINNGSVSYMNRLVASDNCGANTGAQNIIMDEFGTVGSPDPNLPLYRRYFSYFFRDMTDNVNVTIVKIKNNFYAKTESNKFWRFNPETLDVEEKVDLKEFVPTDVSLAHMLADDGGQTWTIGTKLSLNSKYCILKIQPEDNNPFISTRILAEIKSRYGSRPSFMHSFGMTDEHVILIEQALKLSLPSAIKCYFMKKPISTAMTDVKNSESIFYVVSKDSGRAVKYKIDTNEEFVCFHVINTFQDDGNIIVDISAYPYKGSYVVKCFMLDEIKKLDAGQQMCVPQMWRFTLPLNEKNNGAESSDVTPEKYLNFRSDLGTVNPLYQGKRYRYFYGLQLTEHCCTTSKIAKFDMNTGTCIEIDDPDRIPHEPIFVPRPGAILEDDGVVLSPWSSPSEDKPSYLLFVNGSDFKEIARAEIPKEIRMPFTFHGIFVPH